MLGKGSTAQIAGLSLCLTTLTLSGSMPHMSPSTLSAPVSTDVGCLPRLGGPVFLPHPLSPLSAVLLLRVAPAEVSGVTLKGEGMQVNLGRFLMRLLGCDGEW